MSKTKQTKYVKVRHLIMLSLTLLILGVMFHSALYSKLLHWNLVPKQERMTELYFTNPADKPSVYVGGQPIMVCFSVHNMEHSATRYTYRIVQYADSGDDHGDILVSDSFDLAEDELRGLMQSVTLLDMGARSKVAIELTYEQLGNESKNHRQVNESIHFIVTKVAER